MGKCSFWSTQTFDTLPFLLRDLPVIAGAAVYLLNADVLAGCSCIARARIAGIAEGLDAGHHAGTACMVWSALNSMYMCCCGISMSVVWVDMFVIMMAAPCDVPLHVHSHMAVGEVHFAGCAFAVTRSDMKVGGKWRNVWAHLRSRGQREQYAKNKRRGNTESQFQEISFYGRRHLGPGRKKQSPNSLR